MLVTSSASRFSFSGQALKQEDPTLLPAHPHMTNSEQVHTVLAISLRFSDFLVGGTSPSQAAPILWQPVHLTRPPCSRPRGD